MEAQQARCGKNMLEILKVHSVIVGEILVWMEYNMHNYVFTNI